MLYIHTPSTAKQDYIHVCQVLSCALALAVWILPCLDPTGGVLQPAEVQVCCEEHGGKSKKKDHLPCVRSMFVETQALTDKKTSGPWFCKCELSYVSNPNGGVSSRVPVSLGVDLLIVLFSF